MSRGFSWLLLALVLIVPGTAREVMRAPAAGWVAAPAAGAEAALGETDPAAAAEHEVEYLVLDRQVHVAAEEDYSRVVLRVLTEGGLQDAGHWSITYDPTYEKVTVHRLAIRRWGEVFDRLATAEFRYLEQEEQADRHIYDGRVTALTLVPDVRVGDVVEFAYTRRGRNPVFGGRYFGAFSLGWAQPVRHQRVRIVAPPDRPLQQRSFGAEVEPRVTEAGGERRYEWEREDVPAYVREEDTPAWHPTYPRVQVSEFASWAEVVAWARPLYAAADEPPDGALAEALATVLARVERPEERVAQLLEFVQREIRYLGIELGESSHQPHRPEVTFARRFGDCKDKVTVLVQLLRAAGVRAVPVLANSTVGEVLDQGRPSPGAFDHVIVGVELDGRWRWLDPTLAPQLGRLEHRAAPDYGHVLPVAEGTEELVRMSVPEAAQRRVESTETFRSASFEAPAELEVRTRYFGAAAAGVLSSLQQRSGAQTRQNYEEYYHSVYPDIRMTQPVEWKHRPEDGSVTVTERYEIPNFWQVRDDGRRTMEVYPLVVNEYLPKGVGIRRQGPRAVRHPARAELTMRLELPEPWDVTAERVEVEDPAFRFTMSCRRAGAQVVTLTYDYASRLDHVPPERMAGYVAQLQTARDQLGYTFTKYPPGMEPAPAGGRWNEWMFAVAIGAAVLAAVAFALAVRRRRRLPPPLPVPGAPAGLGGWLVLPLLGLCFSSIALLVQIVVSLQPAFDGATWAALTGPEAGPDDTLLAAQLVYEVAGNVIVWVAAVFLLVLFLRRDRTVPVAFRVFLIGNTLFLLGDSLWSAGLGHADAAEQGAGWRQFARQVVACVIWVTYFTKSRRVRNTFVR